MWYKQTKERDVPYILYENHNKQEKFPQNGPIAEQSFLHSQWSSSFFPQFISLQASVPNLEQTHTHTHFRNVTKTKRSLASSKEAGKIFILYNNCDKTPGLMMLTSEWMMECSLHTQPHSSSWYSSFWFVSLFYSMFTHCHRSIFDQ